MATLDISFDEILAEINRLSSKNTEGFTIGEMSDSVGHSKEWCRRKMELLIKGDKAYCNGRARRLRIDGQATFIPVYLIK